MLRVVNIRDAGMPRDRRWKLLSGVDVRDPFDFRPTRDENCDGAVQGDVTQQMSQSYRLGVYADDYQVMWI